MKTLVLISQPAQLDLEQRILAFAEWMGVAGKRIVLGNDANAIRNLSTEIGDTPCAVAISTETLALLRELAPPDVLNRLIEKQFAEMLVFTFGGSSRHEELLSWLTGGRVSGSTPAEEKQTFQFSEGGRNLSHLFAGLSFSMQTNERLPGFRLCTDNVSDVQEIMAADGSPVFIRVANATRPMFLLGLARIPDIGEPLSQSKGIEEYYEYVIPILIFLRHAFASTCWRGTERAARLIIDDPLLEGRYGFLDYGSLRNSMSSAGYGTSVAFIPWNYWRTSRNRARESFSGTNLSICVHGCDHTNMEFGGMDAKRLESKAGTALSRMEQHQRRTGLPFDRVMVFPQGVFSRSAMFGLRAAGFLAAVNTTCFPAGSQPEKLTIADFLRPAITRFHGLPLFPRRYPVRLIDSAFDIFLGRPALLVQHHDDFRDGYRRLEEFVAGLRRVEPSLNWDDLSSQFKQTCLVRSPSEGKVEIQFFTRLFEFRSDRATPTTFILMKHEPDPAGVSSVLVNGVKVPFSFKNGFLIVEHQADGGRGIDLEVVDVSRPAAKVSPAGVRHAVSVTLRRALSEFRDNRLSRHPQLLKAATRLAKTMRATASTAR